jgi:hypothetical protein
MSAIKTTAIQQEHLEEVGRFLHENLNRKISVQAWVNSLTHPWSDVRPNYGMQMRDGDRLVGVFCAIYSDQTVNGKSEKFCNPHTWCVLEDYRNHGISLVLSIIKQRGYHFTMLTPNPKVAEIFRSLKFKDLGKEIAYFPNLPALRFGQSIVESRPDAIAQHLSPAARRDYELHRDIPWLRFLAFGTPGDICLVVYKAGRWKRLPSARLLHVSDAAAFGRHLPLLRNHFLRKGFATTSVETRMTAGVPRLAYRIQRRQGKLFMSSTLNDAQITDLYSELVSLDIWPGI